MRMLPTKNGSGRSQFWQQSARIGVIKDALTYPHRKSLFYLSGSYPPRVGGDIRKF
jgi:hypothetical protein